MNQEDTNNVDEAQVGRILHIVLTSANGRFLCRPAICIEQTEEIGVIALKAFTRFNSVDYDNVKPNHVEKEDQTWHWPRECGHLKNAE